MTTAEHQTNTDSLVVARPTQAQAVIAKFGTACQLAKMLSAHLGRQISVSTVYRWTYRREDGGTGGLIPGSSLRNILAMAARQVPPVIITRDDLYP